MCKVNKVDIFMLEMYCVCYPLATAGLQSFIAIFPSSIQVSENLYPVQDALTKEVVILSVLIY